MRKNIVIIGAGGHGRVAMDIAKQIGYENIVFLDDSKREDVTVSGKCADFEKYIEDNDFFVAIGNNTVREKITTTLKDAGAYIATLVHPSAVIGFGVKIGEGTIIVAGTVVNTGAIIGDGVIINTCSSIDHDDVVEDYCHVSVGAHLAGTVRVGKKTFVGAGATVINNVSVVANCMIGAGAVVVKDITASGTYVGVPARRIK